MNELLRRVDEAEQLAHTLLLFAAKLRETAADEGALQADYEADSLVAPEARVCSTSILQAARWIYRARRRREDYFDAGLFGEPAWDILLDLYVAFVSDRDINISSVSVASNAPVSTAHRWIAILEHQGLVERRRAPHDARIQYVRLTKTAASSMRRYLLEIENTHAKQRSVFALASG